METFKFVVKVNGKKYDTSIKNIYNKSLKELRKDAHDKVYYQYVIKEKLSKKREA